MLFKENLPTAFFVALATSQKVILDFLWLEFLEFLSQVTELDELVFDVI